MTDLVFPDQQGYADLATLVRRARQADPDAAVRLQVTGAVLRVWVGVLPGTGLLADGAAVGVRGIELANEDAGGSASEAGALDLVCASAALSDRFAYDGVGASRLSVPPASTYAAWAGALPGGRGVVVDWSHLRAGTHRRGPGWHRRDRPGCRCGSGWCRRRVSGGSGVAPSGLGAGRPDPHRGRRRARERCR